MRVNDLTRAIIGAAIEVHRVLGQGCWNQHTRNVCAMSLLSEESGSNDNIQCRSNTRG
jgi:hypothetical protein